MRAESLFHNNGCRHPHYLADIKFAVAVDDIFVSAHYNPDLHEFEVLPHEEHSAKLNSCAHRHYCVWHLRLPLDVHAMDYNYFRECRTKNFAVSDFNKDRKHWKFHPAGLPDESLRTFPDIRAVPDREAPQAKLPQSLNSRVKPSKHEEYTR